jgi:hypothetical protein
MPLIIVPSFIFPTSSDTLMYVERIAFIALIVYFVLRPSEAVALLIAAPLSINKQIEPSADV